MVEKEKGTSKVKETIPHGNPETTLTVKTAKITEAVSFVLSVMGRISKLKRPIQSSAAGAGVHLPEPTVTTLRVIHKANIVFGRANLAPINKITALSTF